MKRAVMLLLFLLLFLAACGRAEPAPAKPTEAPAETDNAWLEELPWEEDWVCLLLGTWELEPETGKEALRALLYSYDWVLADPAAEERVYDPEEGIHRRPTTWETHVELSGKRKLRFHLRENGDLYWNGTLRRPVGPGGGAGLIEKYETLEKTGVNTASAPALTLLGGEGEYRAILYGGGTWTYITRGGEKRKKESEPITVPHQQVDWLDAGYPILQAEGELTLRFAGPEPTGLRLFAFTDPNLMAYTPMELREGRFTPFAGVNTYVIQAEWAQVKEGGFGRGTYILLIEGGEGCGPEVEENPEVVISFTEVDGYGCAYTLENRGERFLDIYDHQYDLDRYYTLLRRTEAGGWEWVKPIRLSKERLPQGLRAGESLDWVWDWSYAYGPLEPGEYCLQLRCSLTADRQQEVFFLRRPFTVADPLPPGLGPERFCGFFQGWTAELEMLSPHRWVQTVLTAEDRWVTERDFSLYRVGEGGLSYIPPKYRLPAQSSNYQAAGDIRSLAGRENLPLEVDLASRYGDLPAGTYVLRRRFLRFTEEEWRQITSSGGGSSPLARLWDWRLVPEERLVHGDMYLTLEENLKGTPLPAAYRDEYGYTGNAPLARVTAEAEFTGDGASVTWRAAEDLEGTVRFSPALFRLYFRWGEEWFPLEELRVSYVEAQEVTLAAGEAAEACSYSWRYFYALPLSPGDYRLLCPCTLTSPEWTVQGYVAADCRID